MSGGSLLGYLTLTRTADADLAPPPLSSWATEDPNPTQIVVERDRIEKLGKEGVSAKLNPDMVEAVQSIQALENEEVENYYRIEPTVEGDADEDNGRAPKRARIENGSGGGAASNGNGNGQTKSSAPTGGLLGADGLENLKYFADLARQQAEEAKAAQAGAKKAVAKPDVKGLLGGYGSDSD